MSRKTLNCDQAIFTSVRTMMGEGYRIIAASGGLGRREKQVITTHSPSHDGLCRGSADKNDPPSASQAVAFYPLPEGRFCVAISRPAGTEHTGRGGQRIYTQNLIIDEEDFRATGYNPFVIRRAMICKGLDVPQLKPPASLPRIELEIPDASAKPANLAMHESLHATCRCHLLKGLLEGRSFVINLDDDWLESAEAVLLGVPGPMRVEISLSAGLRFSVGRINRLQVLHDDSLTTRSRLTGQPVEYLEPATDRQRIVEPSTWVAFVERHWKDIGTVTLARRTSRVFSDYHAEGLERIARLYNRMDEIDETASAELLRDVETECNEDRKGTERDIAEEFLAAAQSALLARIEQEPWVDIEDLWIPLTRISKRTKCGKSFAEPLVLQALRTAMRDDAPVEAQAPSLPG